MPIMLNLFHGGEGREVKAKVVRSFNKVGPEGNQHGDEKKWPVNGWVEKEKANNYPNTGVKN